jgi:hypothetical protein
MMRRLWWVLLLGAAVAGCGGQPLGGGTTAAPTPVALSSTADATATVAPPAAATPLATRVGADYVLRLPREAAVPAGWAMSPAPDYEVRQPQAGDTYHFACADLPARAVGQASVGYRSLEGMPSIHIEYVIYPTVDSAAAALEDMLRTTADCETFTIGEGEGATTATFTPLAFPAYGDAGFAAALRTYSPVTGELLTHMVKVRRGHVVIGISHANYADEPAPDAALTESLVALALNNLADGPAAPGE